MTLEHKGTIEDNYNDHLRQENRYTEKMKMATDFERQRTYAGKSLHHRHAMEAIEETLSALGISYHLDLVGKLIIDEE